MLKSLIRNRLAAAEKKLGASLDYVRAILDASLPAFFKFSKVLSFADSRRRLPPGPWFVAGLAATRVADCGTCVQIGIDQALDAGLAAEIVRAAAEGRPESLPADLALVWQFADAVARGRDGPREEVRKRWGDIGLVELAFAIAAGGIFPTVKRALGHATSCSATTWRYGRRVS